MSTQTSNPEKTQLIIISGRSGSGKTTALQALEDIGFYCVDNLPAQLIPELVRSLINSNQHGIQAIAVGIDARNVPEQLPQLPQIIDSLRKLNVSTKIVYLDSNDTVLLQRFSATRRKHPLSDKEISLAEAIEEEKKLLLSISNIADLNIDTSLLNIHKLREAIKKSVGSSQHGLALQFVSFGYKKGVPSDADFVYDVRCLPNPHWCPELRDLTGRDPEVAEFLKKQETSTEMLEQIYNFLRLWIPRFEESNRAYLTVAIGCTGGQHRSVYISEGLKSKFELERDNVQIRHRELSL